MLSGVSGFFTGREKLSALGLEERVKRLSGDGASARGLSAKRLRLIESLENLKALGETAFSGLKDQDHSNLKERGITSKFLRGFIKSEGSTYEQFCAVTQSNSLSDGTALPSQLEALIDSTVKKMTDPTVSKSKFKKYLKGMNHQSHEGAYVNESLPKLLGRLTSERTKRLNSSASEENSKAEKKWTELTYSKNSLGFAEDLSKIPEMIYSSDPLTGKLEKATADVLKAHLTILPSEKNGNRLSKILGDLKDKNGNLKDLRPYLLNDGGQGETGSSLIQALCPNGEGNLPTQVQEIFKALRKKFGVDDSLISTLGILNVNQKLADTLEAKINKSFKQLGIDNEHQLMAPGVPAFDSLYPEFRDDKNALEKTKKIIELIKLNQRMTAADTSGGQTAPIVRGALDALSSCLKENISESPALKEQRDNLLDKVDISELKQALGLIPAVADPAVADPADPLYLNRNVEGKIKSVSSFLDLLKNNLAENHNSVKSFSIDLRTIALLDTTGNGPSTSATPPVQQCFSENAPSSQPSPSDNELGVDGFKPFESWIIKRFRFTDAELANKAVINGLKNLFSDFNSQINKTKWTVKEFKNGFLHFVPCTTTPSSATDKED